MASHEESANQPRAQPPEETTLVQITPIKKVAGGIPAALTAVKSSWSQMGPIRGTRALLHLNQMGGFDCPGCAWPEPDNERSHAEFCENGPKHVADEATTKRLTPEFFQRWSVADLANQSDYWLGQQGRLTQPLVLREHATHYEPLSWNDAFDMVAGALNSLNHPDEAIFYTSGRASN